MEQLNTIHSGTKEDDNLAVLNSEENKMNSSLLNKIRSNFGIFGSISLVFGVFFTFCFYKAGIGINALLFALVMVCLLIAIMNKLSIPLKKATISYYIGSLLLGLSCVLTSSWILQFLNIIGMIMLLELSLLHQFYEDDKWNFSTHLIRMFLVACSAIASIAMPFVDVFKCFKNSRFFKHEKTKNILLGIFIALPLLWVIVGLLSSADLLFGKMAHDIYKFIFSSNLFSVVIMTFLGYITCYCIICGSTSRAGIEEKEQSLNKADSSIAITALSLLCLVYGIFCSIQVLYLFADGLFVLPVEFTFAEYARRGFFELLLVTLINIMLMIICTTWFKESKIIRLLLTFMTACTYIMIGSAVYRMLLYIGAYQLTFLRLFVLLFLLMDIFVLAGVIILVYHKTFPLFGYCVAVVSVCYLLFSFAKPDYFIASYHIQHEKSINEEDVLYLTEELSFDAAPAVVPFLEEKRSNNSIIDKQNYSNFNDSGLSIGDRTIDYYDRIVTKNNECGIRDFNFSNYFASKIVKDVKN